MLPPGTRAAIHLSLTDDHPYAQAFVIVEAVGAAEPELPVRSPARAQAKP
jgi:holo-[acyl-carrier protein] synthase